MDCRSVTLVVFGLLTGVVGFCPSLADGQQKIAVSKVDPAQWLQNRSYERFDYRDDGGLQTHQVIQFGEMAPQGAGCVLPVRVISFDVDDSSHIKEDVGLSLLLDCSKPHLVASILRFVGESGRQQLEATVIGNELAYPDIPHDGMTLPDLHFTARVKRGLLSVLRAKVTILVTGREVRALPLPGSDGTHPGNYEIHSRITAKTFVIGFRVKATGFSSRLVINPIDGLVEDFLEHDGGAHTVIRVAPLGH